MYVSRNDRIISFDFQHEHFLKPNWDTETNASRFLVELFLFLPLTTTEFYYTRNQNIAKFIKM